MPKSNWSLVSVRKRQALRSAQALLGIGQSMLGISQASKQQEAQSKYKQ
jgi:hypothetical protein